MGVDNLVETGLERGLEFRVVGSSNEGAAFSGGFVVLVCGDRGGKHACQLRVLNLQQNWY